MSDMKAFEIHTYQSGKWKIDSVFEDRDLAMFKAQRMDSSGRYTGIRVVEEIYSSLQERRKPAPFTAEARLRKRMRRNFVNPRKTG